jgi:hypothetical protein
MFAIPPPPLDCGIVVEQRDDNLRITLPPMGWRTMRGGLVFMTIGAAFSLGMAMLGSWLWLHRPSDDGATLFFIAFVGVACFLAIGCCHGIAWYTQMASADVEIVLSAKLLTIIQRSRWRRSIHEFSRDRVTSFDADMSGLWLLGGKRDRTLFSERPLHEKRWLADVLAGFWNVPSREPKLPDELDVYVHLGDEDGKPHSELGYIRGFTPEGPLDGRLRVAGGELTVRLSVVRSQPLRYVKRWKLQIRTGSWSFIPFGIPLSAGDLT